MKAVAKFTRTTLIGGLLVVLPVYVSILLLAESPAIVVTLLSPVTAQIPEAMQFRQIIASLILIAVCFIAGIITHTGAHNSRSNAICSTGSPVMGSSAGWPRAWRDDMRMTCSPWHSWRWGMDWSWRSSSSVTTTARSRFSYPPCPRPPLVRSLSSRRSACISSMSRLLRRRQSSRNGVPARASYARP
jgi:hypothetical protein